MSSSLQAEILSVLIGIMRKSERNLLACIDANIYDKLFEILNDIDNIVADLLVDILTVITSLTINVNQLKILLRYLKTENNIWKKHAVKLLHTFKSFPQRHGPDEFFNFPGRNDSGLVLPPIKTWPYQNGFTISTWFRIDPVANSVIEKEKPYLYWFCTSKGHGYTAHFVGNCLVISYTKPKEKNFQHCIQFEFKSREWYMITFAHQYQRWAKSSIQCHINGQLVSTAYFPWSIESGDIFDKCYIGCTPDHNDLTSFSCQLSTFYLFSIYLEPLIVQGLYKLGPAYRNQFKFENESAHMLTDAQRKAMYDGKLMNSIVFNYNPVSCEEQLVLQTGPKTNISHFVHNAHAQMLSNVRSVVARSIYSTLHSIGGVQVFFPLFAQLDHQQSDGSINYDVCSILLFTLCELIERSYTIQHQMLSSKGFLMIGYYLEKILVEKVSGPIVEKRSVEITSDWKIENPSMIKVIATLLGNSPDNIHLYDMKSRFLDDMIFLLSSAKYLLGLAYIYQSNDQQIAVTDRVFELLNILLHHAIKFEFDGWRITKEDYYRKINKMVENMKDDDENDQKTTVSTSTASGPDTPIDGQSVTTLANHQIFCANVVHIISQMSEVLCNGCGGLLPLLARAT
ncbi:unnamed protein product [Rotaria sp. Silwood2]|nr:unnamed protein product [Rotaria sp. Silwood2]